MSNSFSTLQGRLSVSSGPGFPVFAGVGVVMAWFLSRLQPPFSFNRRPLKSLAERDGAACQSIFSAWSLVCSMPACRTVKPTSLGEVSRIQIAGIRSAWTSLGNDSGRNRRGDSQAVWLRQRGNGLRSPISNAHRVYPGSTADPPPTMRLVPVT